MRGEDHLLHLFICIVETVIHYASMHYDYKVLHVLKWAIYFYCLVVVIKFIITRFIIKCVHAVLQCVCVCESWECVKVGMCVGMKW